MRGWSHAGSTRMYSRGWGTSSTTVRSRVATLPTSCLSPTRSPGNAWLRADMCSAWTNESQHGDHRHANVNHTTLLRLAGFLCFLLAVAGLLLPLAPASSCHCPAAGPNTFNMERTGKILCEYGSGAMDTAAVRAVCFDLSGVLYEGESVIPGAVETVAGARERDLVLRFVTNTATRSTEQLLDKLHGFGIPVEPQELFTAPVAAREYITQRRLRPYCLVHPAIRGEFASLDQQQPDCVVLGDARDELSYASLNQAFRLCMEGAPLIGIGMNRYFKDEDGLQLDAGAFIHALEWAVETEAVIMGKPSAAFYAQVVQSTPFEASACLMVGDDADADVAGAMQAGLQGCLVRTGKYRPGDEDRLPEGAQVIDSVRELRAMIDTG